MKTKLTKGFTIVELLIVIAIITVLITIIYAQLNPQKQIENARRIAANRDINELIVGIKLYKSLDNEGNYPAGIQNLADGEALMIKDTNNDGATDYIALPSVDCPAVNVISESDTQAIKLKSAAGDAVDLSTLVTKGYVTTLNSSYGENDGGIKFTDNKATGYWVGKTEGAPADNDGKLVVGSCYFGGTSVTEK